ncbi:MAG TPA: hypothetical protein VK009_04475 [Chloroflexota bacterium]|nr:hypothetical protein [Chloroflexota bacterium]
MTKWLVVVLLAVQAHFAASYLVPLDEQSQQEFGGLLRWFWPWAQGDSGPLGQMTAAGFPLPSFYIAVAAAGLFILSALAVAGVWVSPSWWRGLATAGAVLSMVLMLLFPGPTKLIPITFDLLGLWIAFGHSPVALTR